MPDEVAVIGVDNDSLVCDLADPPMSSVISDARRAGYAAADLLQQMMSGQKVPAAAHLIKPLGIETRQSTDVLATNDADVSNAIRFIREHACEGTRVADILEHVPLSRRILEQRFKTLLGRTPHDEIARV